MFYSLIQVDSLKSVLEIRWNDYYEIYVRPHAEERIREETEELQAERALIEQMGEDK